MRRQPGLVSYVDVGCRVFSTTRSRAGAGGDTEPIGGLVVAVTEKLDQETGEIDRAFLVFDDQQTRPYIRWATIREVEVDKSLIEAVDAATLTRAWRRLAEDICCSGKWKFRRGAGTAGEVRAARAVLELQALVFGRDGDQWGELEPPTQGAPAAERPSQPVNVSALVD